MPLNCSWTTPPPGLAMLQVVWLRKGRAWVRSRPSSAHLAPSTVALYKPPDFSKLHVPHLPSVRCALKLSGEKCRCWSQHGSHRFYDYVSIQYSFHCHTYGWMFSYLAVLFCSTQPSGLYSISNFLEGKNLISLTQNMCVLYASHCSKG